MNEAMASNLPCIASDACGCAEDLVAPISPQLTFPLGDISAIAAAIQSIMSDPPSIDLIRRRVDDFSLSKSISTVTALCGARKLTGS